MINVIIEEIVSRMDGKSVMSASSVGSMSSETRNSFQASQEQPKNRKFFASLGKIG